MTGKKHIHDVEGLNDPLDDVLPGVLDLAKLVLNRLRGAARLALHHAHQQIVAVLEGAVDSGARDAGPSRDVFHGGLGETELCVAGLGRTEEPLLDVRHFRRR